jgi:hypothetical protein
MKYKEMNTFLRGSKNNINVWACYKENKNQVNTLPESVITLPSQ